MRKFKCSRRRAIKKVENLFSEIRFERFRLGQGINCFLFDADEDLGPPQNRVKKIDEFFNSMIDMSENWREMRSAAYAASGGRGDMNNNFKNMNVKKWPPHSMILFADQVLDYEKESLIFNKKHFPDPALRAECERIRVDHKKLIHIIMEEIILLGEEPAKRFLCDVLIKYLDPSNSKELLEFYVLDESRRRLMGNINLNNNNTYGSGNDNKFSDLSKARALPDGVCWWWTFGTCRRGSRCPYKHICILDGMKNHGLRSCLNFKNLKFGNKFGKNNSYSYNSGNRGFGRGRGFNNGNHNGNMNRNSYDNSAGDGYPPPPTNRRRTGDVNFSYGNWNVSNDSNNNNNHGIGSGNSGMMPSVPGMQYTMVPMLTPISENNKKKKKSNPN